MDFRFLYAPDATTKFSPVMKLKLFQVDAFAHTLFSGNPAAVIPLASWIDDELMQTIAQENNLSETVFFVPEQEGPADFHIRWFTPAVEINLCGHATLAAAFILFTELSFGKPDIVFRSKSGLLTVRRENGKICMDFPAWMPEPIYEYNRQVLDALGNPPVKGVYRYRDLLFELGSEEDVRNLRPDFTLLGNTGEKVIVTAPGSESDFVSRFFAPSVGINEDPVTGSAHSQLIPFWARKTGRDQFLAKQLSARGGTLWCSYEGERVTISGECILYLAGECRI